MVRAILTSSAILMIIAVGPCRLTMGQELPASRCVENEVIRTYYEHLLGLLGVDESGDFKLNNEWSAAVREILRLQGRDKEIERVMSASRPWGLS